jgi:hypothetical protein
MYKKRNAIATPGMTKPTSGTRIEGKKEAAIINIIPNVYRGCTIDFI